MTKDEEQEILLEIVETWRPSETPEYRGFRCANCQQYKNQAWYHWVNTGGYRLPIHMCDDKCEPAFQSGNILIDQSKRAQVDRKTFGNSYKYSEKAVQKFRQIVSTWPKYQKPELKAYTCDNCSLELEIDPKDGMRKGYHVWWKMDPPDGEASDGQTLAELHFHKECTIPLGITG